MKQLKVELEEERKRSYPTVDVNEYNQMKKNYSTMKQELEQLRNEKRKFNENQQYLEKKYWKLEEENKELRKRNEIEKLYSKVKIQKDLT